jgi:hypothetical protein
MIPGRRLCVYASVCVRVPLCARNRRTIEFAVEARLVRELTGTNRGCPESERS